MLSYLEVFFYIPLGYSLNFLLVLVTAIHVGHSYLQVMLIFYYYLQMCAKLCEKRYERPLFAS